MGLTRAQFLALSAGKRLPPLMDVKKGKTRKESTPIKVWVTTEEKTAIAAKADAHSLSASDYLRRLGLALPVESTIDQRAVLDLVKINPTSAGLWKRGSDSDGWRPSVASNAGAFRSTGA